MNSKAQSMSSLSEIQPIMSIENRVNSLVNNTLDAFVNHLRSYIELRLYKSKIYSDIFNQILLLGFEGRVEEKVLQTLLQLEKKSGFHYKSCIDFKESSSWDLSLLINLFQRYYSDCFGK